MKYITIKNFIHPTPFSSIRDTINGDTFFWFYNEYINTKPCEYYKFTNEIIKDSNITSNFFINYVHMIKPVLEKLQLKKLHSVRFNLFVKNNKPQKHIINNHKKKSKVAILFTNTSDGGLEIDKNFIESTENTLVFFNNMQYKIITPTKNKIFTYVVINYD